MDNRFNPKDLYPKSRAYVVREQGSQRGLDVMHWDVTAGHSPMMTQCFDHRQQKSAFVKTRYSSYEP